MHIVITEHNVGDLLMMPCRHETDPKHTRDYSREYRCKHCKKWLPAERYICMKTEGFDYIYKCPNCHKDFWSMHPDNYHNYMMWCEHCKTTFDIEVYINVLRSQPIPLTTGDLV